MLVAVQYGRGVLMQYGVSILLRVRVRLGFEDVNIGDMRNIKKISDNF